jgi:hypothetical protein
MSNSIEIVCFNGNKCEFFNCKFTHVGNGSKCAWGKDCDRQFCSFKHPAGCVVGPNCSYGNNCGKNECAFRHGEKGTTTLCEWGAICNRTACAFIHERVDRNDVYAIDQCKYDNECRINACQYYHGDEKSKVDCKWMSNCTRTLCDFNHTEKTNYRKCPRGPSCPYYKGADAWCKLRHE